MWNAECGMSVEASPRASTSHFNSAFRTPHSALSPHQRHRYIANYLERRGTHLVDRVFRRVPVRVVEVHDVDRVDARFLQGDVIVGQRLLHARSEEHTSELQSRLHLVCRLLLEKKNSTSWQP